MKQINNKREILSGLCENRMFSNVKELCKFDKTSGTTGEFEAVQYIKNQLDLYGITNKKINYDGYLSYPLDAKLEVVSPYSKIVSAKTRSFSACTDNDGLSGELLVLPSKINSLPKAEYFEYLNTVDFKGKIVVNESGGLGNQRNMYYTALYGAIGYINICITEKDVIHEGIASPIWGTPTPETKEMLSKIPIIAITYSEGQDLLQSLSDNKVVAKIYAKTSTNWQKQEILEASIEGETDQYVLIGAHLDTWYYGATDNTTGSSICLEIARVLNDIKHTLKRGIKIVWWPGHSTGRYGGSTYYCDINWHDLYSNCISYINIDMLGSQGATNYSKITVTSDIYDLAKDCIKEVTGQVSKRMRPTRSADQSFWGVGLPYTYILSNREQHLLNCGPNSGTPWWWHNEHDTLDKVDKNVLLTDAQIHLLIVLGLCCDDVVPLSLMSSISEIKSIVEDYKYKSKNLFDFEPVITEIRELLKLCLSIKSKQKFLKSEELAEYNKDIIKALKYLTQINYSNVSPYEHSLGLDKEPLGLLSDAKLLPKLQGSDEFGFVVTKLVRNRNFVVQNLKLALEILNKIKDTN